MHSRKFKSGGNRFAGFSRVPLFAPIRQVLFSFFYCSVGLLPHCNLMSFRVLFQNNVVVYKFP